MARIGDAIPTVRSQTGANGRTNEQVSVGSSAAVNTSESEGENSERIRTKAATNIQRRVRGTISRLKQAALKKHGFKCSIKQDTIDVHDSTLTNCGHIFDRQSLNTWIEKETVSKSSVDCPNCRKDIVSVMSIDSQLLLFARDGKEGDIVDVVRRGANMNATDTNGCTAVHMAAINGHTDTVRVLVNELGAGVNTRNKYGSTALHWAARKGQTDTVKVLIFELGADMDARDKYGRVALHVAVFNGQLDTVRVLVWEFGFDVNTGDTNGDTVLHWAANNEYFNTLRVLVKELGADVDARNMNGWTAAHVAAAQGNTNTIKVLVNEFGANLAVGTNFSTTAVDLAASAGHTNTARVLEELNPRNLYCTIS